MRDPIEQFKDALAGRGIIPPTDLIADGKLHRCDAEGKGGKGDAVYLLHLDGLPAGGFENHRDGLGWQNWRADTDRPLTHAEEAAHRARIEAARRVREVEDVERKQEARDRARLILAEADHCQGHGYLTRKGIAAHGVKVITADKARNIAPNLSPELEGPLLVVPMRDADGVAHSLQFITETGVKRPLTGGRVQGCYFAIGKPEGVICVAEGFATGASVHVATGHATAIAFSCGNLKAVAEALRVKYPGMKLIVCADDDCHTEGNPGLTKAMEAARAVGGLLAVPDFGANRPEEVTDFNDLHQTQGLEAVKRCIASATPPDDGERQPVEENPPAGEYARNVTLTCADSITPERIDWLWPDWLAAGKLHILGGAPGTGKTTIALSLAATVTIGGRWPDGSHASFGNVVIWSGEDGIGDTLVPRLAASGADLSRVFFVGDVIEREGPRSFDPARDVEPLRRKLAGIGGVSLLIVDPIVSAVTGDSHKNAEVRRGLQPLVDLAASMRCALIGVTHFTKGTIGRDPTERITGSLAFGALARVVLVAAKHQEECDDGSAKRIFCRAKSNIGADNGGFEYDLQQSELKAYPGIFASSVLWGNAIDGNARDLLAVADATGDDGEGGTLSDAKQFLIDLLSDGPLPSKTIKADSDAAGYSWAAIRRAQKALGIEAVKEGGNFGGGKQQWVWRLPLKMLKDAEQKNMSAFSAFSTFSRDAGFRAKNEGGFTEDAQGAHAQGVGGVERLELIDLGNGRKRAEL